METDIPRSLLSLPAELRNMIYDRVIPNVPLKHPRSLYVGIMYTCNQLRAEVEPMVLSKMQEELDAIFSACLEYWNDVFTFSKPQTLHELENLTLNGRIDFSKRCLKSRAPRTQLHHRIRRLMMMHFHTLIINIDCNHDTACPGTYCLIETDWITRNFSTHRPQHSWPCLKNLTLDLSQALLCAVSGRRRAGGHVKTIQRESLLWDLEIETRADGADVSFRFQQRDTQRIMIA